MASRRGPRDGSRCSSAPTTRPFRADGRFAAGVLAGRVPGRHLTSFFGYTGRINFADLGSSGATAMEALRAVGSSPTLLFAESCSGGPDRPAQRCAHPGYAATNLPDVRARMAATADDREDGPDDPRRGASDEDGALPSLYAATAPS